MAKKAAKAKKIKKAKPASKGKNKIVKKKTGKKKPVKITKPKPVKTKAPIKKEKKIKATKKPEVSAKPAIPGGKAPAKFNTVRESLPPALMKRKREPRAPKPKKIKQVFLPFNPIQPASSTGKPVNTTKKEPEGKFELEYVIRCSESLLYEFTTTPSGLSEWFADDVNVRDGIYTFFWDGSQQDARLLSLKEDLFVRYQWKEKTDGSYFEFRIQTDELTGDVSLIITDFAETEEEHLSAKLLWDTQIDKLMKTIGSHS